MKKVEYGKIIVKDKKFLEVYERHYTSYLYYYYSHHVRVFKYGQKYIIHVFCSAFGHVIHNDSHYFEHGIKKIKLTDEEFEKFARIKNAKKLFERLSELAKKLKIPLCWYNK
jgi:hypothetical protein